MVRDKWFLGIWNTTHISYDNGKTWEVISDNDSRMIVFAVKSGGLCAAMRLNSPIPACAPWVEAGTAVVVADILIVLTKRTDGSIIATEIVENTGNVMLYKLKYLQECE